MEKVKQSRSLRNYKRHTIWIIKGVFYLSTFYLITVIWTLIQFYLLKNLLILPISFWDYSIFFVSFIIITYSYILMRKIKYVQSLQISLIFYLIIIIDRVYCYYFVLDYVALIEILVCILALVGFIMTIKLISTATQLTPPAQAK